MASEAAGCVERPTSSHVTTETGELSPSVACGTNGSAVTDTPLDLYDVPFQTPAAFVYRPVLLDIQLVETVYGCLIKELAYKSPTWWVPNESPRLLTDRSLHYACYRHNPSVVPSSATFKSKGSVRDRYSGLAIDCGEERYSDGRVLSELGHYNLILLKGHNKKQALLELYARNAGVGTGRAPPTIVNVDSYSMDAEDAEFCRQYLNGKGAKFSFNFVYRRFSAYMKMMRRRHDYCPTDLPVYLNNAIIHDKRFRPLGRPLWVCPHDHACGRRWLSAQRCAALNVGLLETLWFLMREHEYREVVKADNRRQAYCRHASTAADSRRHTVNRDERRRLRKAYKPAPDVYRM